MLKCNSCGHEQAEGKFCAECGAAVSVVEETVQINQQEVPVEQQEAFQQAAPVEQDAQPDAPNETVENVKAAASDYFGYFKETLKKPSSAFAQDEKGFKNGLISIILFIVLTALASYTFSYKSAKLYSFGYYDDVPFFKTFGSALLVLILVIAIVTTVLFVVNKLFSIDKSYKSVIGLVGAHASLALILTLVSLLLLLIGSLSFGMILLVLSIGLVAGTAPIYLISSLLTRSSKGLDPFYVTLIYIVGVSIAFVIVMAVFSESLLSNIDMPFF